MRTSAASVVRLQMAAALEKRAAGQGGEVRRLLDDRLALLAREPVVDCAGNASREAHSEADKSSLLPSLSALAVLLAEAAAARSHAVPAVDAVDQFRRIWSTVRTESQLRQSMQQAPDNAGPLNSAALVHRAIALMRGISPGYLQHFLSYVDDLSSIEALFGSASAAKETPRVASAKKRAKTRPRLAKPQEPT